MPKPLLGESRDDYISRCIPIVIHEGTAKDPNQAVAICHSMWDKHQEGKAVWLKLEEVRKICPNCATKMEQKGWTKLNVAALDMPEFIDELMGNVETEWDKLHESHSVADIKHDYHTAKMERCLGHLLDKGFDEGSSHAICYATLGEEANKSIGKVPNVLPDEEDPENEIKRGARHSRKDQEKLQSIHDAANSLGASCPRTPEWTQMPKSLGEAGEDEVEVFDGDAIKAVATADGLKLAGYLVRFTKGISVDATGEYFDKDTDFDLEFPAQSTVYFDHGKNKIIGQRKLGKATLTMTPEGIFAETLLKERDEYEMIIADFARKGKLGWSSGTAKHLIVREPQEGHTYLKRWPLGLDATITHRPAEPKNVATSLKSFIPAEVPERVAAEETKPNKKEFTMDADTQKEIAAIVAEAIKTAIPAVVTEAVKAAQPAPVPVAEPKQQGAALITKPNVNTKTKSGFADDAVKGFLNFIQTGKVNGALLPDNKFYEGLDADELKVAMAGQIDAAGGFYVPDDFYGRIIEKRNELSIARKIGVLAVPTQSDRLLFPVEGTAATKFVVTAETGAYDENEPTAGQVPVTIHKMTKLIKLSEEWEADAPGADAYLAGVWGRALAAAENYYFIVSGTGTAMPQAMAVGGSLGKTTAAAALIAVGDIQGLLYAMPDQYVDNLAFVCSRPVLGLIRALTTVAFAFTDMPQGKGGPKDVSPNGYLGAGIPVYCTSAMPTAIPVVTATKTALLVNPDFYAIAERQSLSVARNPWLYQANGQIGLFAKVREGGAVLQSEAILWMLQA
jgi:HK97 family phage major capsid protein